MTCKVCHAGNPAAILVVALLVLLGCTSNPEPRMMSELMDRKPACLALNWGATKPSFFGSTAPDTMVLMPDGGKPLGRADSGGTEGRVALARSQQDREGGGWIWWTRSDTLWISSQTPTMDDLIVMAVRPEGRVAANWKGSGMAARERGQVALHPYKCNGLPEPAP